MKVNNLKHLLICDQIKIEPPLNSPKIVDLRLREKKREKERCSGSLMPALPVGTDSIWKQNSSYLKYNPVNIRIIVHWQIELEPSDERKRVLWMGISFSFRTPSVTHRKKDSEIL